jgi:toxin ParE1/3/4
MSYTILVTPTATNDIAVAIEYYNALATDLGYRFADLVATYFDRIADYLPPPLYAIEMCAARP